MLEANLQALSTRMPDLPLDALLLSRLLLHVGREFASMLEQQIRPFGGRVLGADDFVFAARGCGAP
jgi:hypothetical protein